MLVACEIHLNNSERLKFRTDTHFIKTSPPTIDIQWFEIDTKEVKNQAN